MPDPKIRVIPVTYQETMALLTSEVLRDIEDRIAGRIGLPVLRDYSATSVNDSQALISVSGMSANDLRVFLGEHCERIVAFNVRLMQDSKATCDEGEYPEGEEPDEDDRDQTLQVLGLASGFGILHAIYCNFLANRSASEFLAFLKNRRTPHASKTAKELKRIFKESVGDDDRRP
jgi:hypothetical protein